MIAIVALALLAAGQPADTIDCDDARNQAEMNECAARDFEAADAELNRVWREALDNARDLDREPEANGDERPSYQNTLRDAQRAWLAFRDAQCTWEGYEARGGSMETMLYEMCRANLTRERTGQLRGSNPDQ
jgi:uncharacterized protein YecT (DUF1311 family)